MADSEYHKREDQFTTSELFGETSQPKCVYCSKVGHMNQRQNKYLLKDDVVFRGKSVLSKECIVPKYLGRHKTFGWKQSDIYKVSRVKTIPLSLPIVNVIFFVGFSAFFLRYTETGKCIAALNELVYDNPYYSFPYFVQMTDNCLDKKAQFRFLDSQQLHNIEKDGTLVSSPNADYKGRWAVYKGLASGARRYQQSADHRLKQTAAGSLSF